MPVPFACPQCHSMYNIPDQLVGSTIQCKYCGAVSHNGLPEQLPEPNPHRPAVPFAEIEIPEAPPSEIQIPDMPPTSAITIPDEEPQIQIPDIPSPSGITIPDEEPEIQIPDIPSRSAITIPDEEPEIQ